MKVLRQQWETPRLIVQDSGLGEVGRLREVFNACCYAGKWDKSFTMESDEGFVQLVSKSLARGEGGNEHFQMQSMHLRERPEIVGYFHLYFGVPRPETVVISMFVLHPDYQNHQFGSEVVKGLVEQLKELGAYTSTLLQVYLKNWPALRFWLKAGFTTIVEYRGDKVHSEDSFASLILQKSL